MSIHPEKYYRPTEVENENIAKVQTLASWRHQNKGPNYVLSGSRVLYKGSDIISWLNTQRIETSDGDAA